MSRRRSPRETGLLHRRVGGSARRLRFPCGAVDDQTAAPVLVSLDVGSPGERVAVPVARRVRESALRRLGRRRRRHRNREAGKETRRRLARVKDHLVPPRRDVVRASEGARGGGVSRGRLAFVERCVGRYRAWVGKGRRGAWVRAGPGRSVPAERRSVLESCNVRDRAGRCVGSARGFPGPPGVAVKQTRGDILSLFRDTGGCKTRGESPAGGQTL